MLDHFDFGFLAFAERGSSSFDSRVLDVQVARTRIDGAILQASDDGMGSLDIREDDSAVDEGAFNGSGITGITSSALALVGTGVDAAAGFVKTSVELASVLGRSR